MSDPFKFELVSPERLLVSADVEQVVVPGTEGDFTMLAYHAPLLSTLRPGLLEIVYAGGKHERYFVRGGFAEVNPQGLTILAETAIHLDELQAEMLTQAITDVETALGLASDDIARDRLATRVASLRQVQTILHL